MVPIAHLMPQNATESGLAGDGGRRTMFYGNCLCGPGGNVVLCMNVAVFEDKSQAANPERCPSSFIADAGIEIDSPPQNR